MMGLTQRRPDDRIEFASTICRPIAIRPWLAAGSAPGNPRTMRQNGTGPVRATKLISGAGAGLEVFSNHLLFRLRERGSLPRATLAMTGHSDPHSRRSCLEAGCAEVLLKPVPIGELLRQIKRHLA